jgi:hypothetical protein
MGCKIVAKVKLTMEAIANIYVEKDEVNKAWTWSRIWIYQT